MPPRTAKLESATANGKGPTAASEASYPSSSSISYPSIAEAKKLVAELCANFYRLGWVSGTGGGLSMRAGPEGENVVMAPSGVQKERMTADDMFVLRKADGEVVETPQSSTAARPLKLSECAPLFMSAYELRDAGAVVHSHSLSAVAATMIQGESSPSFRATHLEMCKGIDGHGFRSTVEVPIIENTARECELTGRLREAILAFPKSNAVLVRRHGVYVWGSTWARAKAQAETYDYLFEAALQLKHAAGIDVSRPPPGWKEEGGGPPPPPPGPAAADPPPPPPSAKSPPRKVPAKKTPAKSQAPSGSAAAGGGNDDGPAQRRPRAEKARISPRRALLAVSPSSPLAPPPVLVDPSAPPKAIVLDIEGTVLPISYVKTKMFPFARQRFGDYLLKNYKKKEVREQLDALRKEQYADASLRGALSARTLQRFDVTKDFGEPANPEDYFEGYAADVILSHQHALELEESQHVKGSWTDAAQKRINKILPIEAQNLVVSCANKYLEALTDADVKSTALKAIQGSIWHEGFVRGELRAPLFADVPDALRRWARQKSIPVFIYSSGSKRAQIDLFAHTNAGDLSHCISGYFDTTSGAKVNASSYQTILRALKVARAPSEVLFVTDILAEGAAAREAGWRVVMASRPGNAPLPAGHGFKEVRDFSREIF